MGLPPISAIRGDGLSDPRKTGRIEAAHFDLAPVSSMPRQRHGHHGESSGEELPYEDAEFVEVIEVSEPESPEDAIPSSSPTARFHAIA